MFLSFVKVKTEFKVPSSALCNPTDVIKVRMQSGDPRFQYRGVTDALISIVRVEGMRGLYKGVWPTTQRAVLITVTTLPTYDLAKKTLLQKDHDRWSFHSK
jgi:solute carrier family 25 protein 14/30